jgi:hypothetical protein
MNLFNDSKLIGHGLKSFRFLCENENYSPIKKIINDNSGNLFIADTSNAVIKKLDSMGNMSVIAGYLGSNSFGGDGGTTKLITN